MAAPTFKEILETGGGNIHYVFQVSGYPWAVATSQTCVDALNAVGNVAARRKIFGTEQDTGSYWADDVSLTPIFPSLEIPSAQSFQLHEGKGEITGGGWSVTIFDIELGHTWEHGGSTIFRGLPGVHHVLGPDYDSSVGWGYLTSNCEIDDDTFTVQEQSGTTLKDGIDAASSFPHRLLWINQECIAADATSSVSGNAYTIEVSKDGSNNLGRGLFRSKHQNHYTEYYSDADPIVTDTPFSIIDKPCWLWAVAMNEDESDILAGPFCIRSGQVSPNIQTRDGVTKIQILPPFKQLDHEIRVPVFAENLDRYIFTRQEFSGSGADTIFLRQAAHLVIYEFNSSGEDSRREIWLCSRSGSATTSVEFDTVDDVLAALENELNLCTQGDSNQKSGDATMGLVTLTYQYSIVGGQLYCSSTGTNDLYYRSLISGPLAWLFNLGPVYSRLEWALGTGEGSIQGFGNRPWFFQRSSFTTNETRTATQFPFMACKVTDEQIEDAAFLEDAVEIDSAFDLVPQSAWVTPYFYQHEYNYDEFKYMVTSQSFKEDWRRSMPIKGSKLYFKKDADLGNINNGENIILGRENDRYKRPRYLLGGVSVTGTSNGYPYVTLANGELYPVNDFKASPIFYGVGLWYIPALEGDIDAIDSDEYSITRMVGPAEAISRTDPTLPFQMNNTDPWQVTQNLTGESSILSDAFRVILKDDDASYSLSANLTLTDICGFSDTTKDDVDSWIDWDSLDQFSSVVLPGKQTYRINVGAEFNLYQQLKNELVFHGIMPTWEWDDSKNHFMMRFRPIGPINITEASASGRALNEEMILRNSQMVETHNDTWMFNKIVAKCNQEAGSFTGNIVVDFVSGNARNRNEARTMTAESQLTFIPSIRGLLPSEVEHITKRYSNMLRQLAIPQAQYSVKTTLASMVSLAVGRECLVTDSTGYYPFSHEQGLVEAPGLVTKIVSDLSKEECTVTVRLTQNQVYGWAPSVYVTASSKSAPDTINCTCTANYFSASGDRWDCTYFDCYTYNKSSGEYSAKGCTCGDYAVIALQRNVDGASWEPTILNFDVTVVDIVDGNSMTLVDQDGGYANYTAWDTSKEYIIIFDTYDNCESCQQKYAFFADDNNTIGSGNIPAVRWV